MTTTTRAGRRMIGRVSLTLAAVFALASIADAQLFGRHNSNCPGGVCALPARVVTAPVRVTRAVVGQVQDNRAARYEARVEARSAGSAGAVSYGSAGSSLGSYQGSSHGGYTTTVIETPVVETPVVSEAADCECECYERGYRDGQRASRPARTTRRGLRLSLAPRPTLTLIAKL